MIELLFRLGVALLLTLGLALLLAWGWARSDERTANAEAPPTTTPQAPTALR